MIDLLNRWTGAILRHSETANTIAEALAEARAAGANLSDAKLRGANLRGANLSDANLSDAKQFVLRIQGSRHEINSIDEEVRIGCQRMPIARWLETFAAVGADNRYTPDQIAEYGLHLAHIAACLKLRAEQKAAA